MKSIILIMTTLLLAGCGKEKVDTLVVPSTKLEVGDSVTAPAVGEIRFLGVNSHTITLGRNSSFEIIAQPGSLGVGNKNTLWIDSINFVDETIVVRIVRRPQYGAWDW